MAIFSKSSSILFIYGLSIMIYHYLFSQKLYLFYQNENSNKICLSYSFENNRIYFKKN